ncbi:MAG TPA: GNAT family N-acetyltransferase [Nocardioidaceae bacterium]|nr:GNAT family N-acetyltransferase [Nocardioidaceae bacterium]
MTPDEYGRWREPAVVEYAQAWVDSGILTSDEALKRAETQFAELLPDGLDTETQEFFTPVDGDESVGVLWVHFDQTDERRAFIYDIQVWEHLRRRGYGRAIITALVDEARSRGARSIGLNVFGSNPGAKALYEQMGFEVAATSMKLAL